MLAYKYRIYPDTKQISILEDHMKICRYLYNYCLDFCFVERSKTPSHTPTAYDMGYLLSSLKKEFPILRTVDSHVLENVTTRVRSGFENFWARKLHGLKAGLLHFKRKDDYNSITYRLSGYKIINDDLTLTDGIGVIKISLHRPFFGKIKLVNISRNRKKWYVSLTCESEPKKPEDLREKIVGVDFGLISVIATSDGILIDAPKKYRNSERRLKRLGRQLSRKKLRSKNWYKSKTKLSKLHEKVANQRKNFAENISRKLVDKYEIIALENLKIDNMKKNKHLSKSIGDAGWGAIKRTIQYMAQMSMGKVILVDPKNTSQICPRCGISVPKTLADRVHSCTNCGLNINRDIASAWEIKNRAKIILQKEVGRCTTELTPVEISATYLSEQSDVRPVSMNQELITNREGLYISQSEKTTFTQCSQTEAKK